MEGGGREGGKNKLWGGRAICWKAAVAVCARGWFLGLPCPTPSLENGSVPGMQRQAFYRARPPDSVRPAGWSPNIKSRHAL